MDDQGPECVVRATDPAGQIVKAHQAEDLVEQAVAAENASPKQADRDAAAEQRWQVEDGPVDRQAAETPVE